MANTNQVIQFDTNDEPVLIDIKIWSVYFLYLNSEIIYIGCTSNIKQRMSSHKQKRKFDSYSIHYYSSDKDRAESVEKILIRFSKMHTDLKLENKQTHNYYKKKIIKI